MCGIFGAVADADNVLPWLLQGLRRLEYRGYDSAGVALVPGADRLECVRVPGKVQALEQRLQPAALDAPLGIAHTRWATHGGPSERNAHPHCSGPVAVVHNGIIENHDSLRAELCAAGYVFQSETDTEVAAHLLHACLREHGALLPALAATVARLRGAFALAALHAGEPGALAVARRGSPLVLGRAEGAYLLASDPAALIEHTRELVWLEEGDIARVTAGGIEVLDAAGCRVERPVQRSTLLPGAADKAGYRHFMLKEIHEQPKAVADTLADRLGGEASLIADDIFGPGAAAVFDRVREVRIVACGTSYHAGMVARYWLESLAGVPCRVEIASEFRYRQPAPAPDALLVLISQSGETADTLEALREARRRGFSAALAICNVAESALTREADVHLLTHAGPEIGVASTKAFTTQLVALMLLVLVLGRRHGLAAARAATLVEELRRLPALLQGVLGLDGRIQALAEQFADKHHALFLGRGLHYPIALEGALKLKEISYIHAEGYPAGELKHGPLALVDADMPVIAVAPNDPLLEKLKSNIQEVRARGGRLLVFADHDAGVEAEGVEVVPVHAPLEALAPVLFTLPLQLLAYHVAVIKGTDVDQPRNLAKSVTVE